MQSEDVIELGSSDEESGPPPPKKMNVRNAMVHIPTKLPGVTIKPVKAFAPSLPKLGKNITITKTTGSASSTLPIKITNKVKPPDKPLQKLATAKKKKINQTAQAKGKLFNPLSQAKKVTVVANSTITNIKPPILIKNLPANKPQPLQRLPPSITVKKTATKVVNTAPKIIMLPKVVAKVAQNVSRKRKLPAVQTVELDDDEATTSSNNHQWYVRPEDQAQISSEKTPSQEENAKSQEKAAVSQEDTNNKEPEGPKYIEITIEDSPTKPARTKRTRELSTEKVITIDDSPNKGCVVSEEVAQASDGETKNTERKVPHSKKKLKYASDLQTIQEPKTIEIEIEPMEVDKPIQLDKEADKESRVISLTPEIIEVEQASVEIAQDKQGAVSVVQTKPLEPKQNARPAPREVAIKSEFHPIYQSFISLCIQLENSNDMEKIIEKKIKPYYRQAPKEYIESEEFLDMVSSKITAMEAAPAKMYLYIKDIVDELNLQRKYMKEIPVEEKSSELDSFLYGKENELDPNKQRQIRKLEKTLKKLNRAIQKLENQEVDFDDEEDSVYLLTEKYKERMVRVHAKFCQLTNTKMPSQPRIVIDPRPGLSAAPAKRLEAWINKKEGAAVFPDFHDVLRCVREANEEDGLGWNEAFIMEEARDLFVRCGRKLQRRRQENEWRIATSRIQPNSDPAEQSDDLRKQLEANRRLGNTKETEVFDKFCDRQSQLKLEAEEIDDKEAEESPVESEEEDNDDGSSLGSKQKRKDRLRRLLQEQSKKNIPTKSPQAEHAAVDADERIKNIESIQDLPGKSQAINEEDQIQSLSDDSNDIGSDMDELHLLQKLHSDNEIRSASTSESDSESPIAISDSLDSSSDDGKPTKQQPGNVISIENSSYSDDSDSQKKNDPKSNKKHTVSTKDLIEESKEIECTSSSIIKNTHTLENTATTLSSSDSESNPDDNTKSGKSDNSSKVCSGTEGRAVDKDFELSIMSETAELCININDYSKPSDAEDEQSTNSDIIAGSSVSSGQYEELLKEHNADPLVKAPDLIPRDPSDKLFDKLVFKHYNDPLIKKTLKGSDSSNGSPFNLYPENSNSDTQSTNAPETVEEAKKDLMETSVDTEELLNSNSPSMQIVDRFIEKLKHSEESTSSDDLLMKVDEQLGLNSDVTCPVTFALEREVNLARQTKAWPRFRDECSLSSADDENTGDSDIAKPNESTRNDCDEKEITSNESRSLRPVAKHNKAWSCGSKCETEEADVNQTGSIDSLAACSKDFSAECPDADENESERTKDALVGIDAEYSDILSTKEPIASSSRCTKNLSEANDAFSSKSPKDTHESMDTAESETSRPKAKYCSGFVHENIEEPINSVESSEFPDVTNETLTEQELLGEHLDSNILPTENSGETDNALMDIFNSNHDNDNGSDVVSNGNVNINMDISELLDSDINISRKSDGGDKDLGVLDGLNEPLSADKGDCRNEEAIPITISSVSSERHD